MFSILKSLLGANSVDEITVKSLAQTTLDKVQDIINIVIPVILGVVLLIGTIYAVYLGIQYSKAEESGKRDEAKQRLVGAVTGFVITLVLILVIYALISVVPKWFGGSDKINVDKTYIIKNATLTKNTDGKYDFSWKDVDGTTCVLKDVATERTQPSTSMGDAKLSSIAVSISGTTLTVVINGETTITFAVTNPTGTSGACTLA